MSIYPFRNIYPRIDESVFIAPGANVIGDVEIGPRSSIWFGSTIRGDVNYIRIGADTNIQDGCIVHVDSGRFATLIGDGVTVGHGAILHACEIRNHAFIGMQACVLDGAVIEEKAMVAAGALVTPGKTVPTGELWAGRPAKLMRKLTDEEMLRFEKSSLDYAELAKIYKNEIKT
jgi:carbonic anhydrase/acetyltransferase-like protein (isoleucine patch superfamily)